MKSRNDHEQGGGLRLVFDAGGTSVRYGLVDETGAVDTASLRLEKTAKNIQTRDDFARLVVQTILSFGGEQRRFVLSVAGPVSADNRIMRKYTNVLKDDSDIPLAEMIEAALWEQAGREARVYVLKDAAAASLAEMGPGGAAPDAPEVIALILGTGTGGALCKREGTGFTLPDALADLGHHQVDITNTEQCNCGARGCVELQTSGTGVARHFNRRSLADAAYARSLLCTVRGVAPGAVTCEDIAWAAAVGDEFTLEGLRLAAVPLAALLRNIFTSHPGATVVFVGGFALGVGEPLLRLTHEAVAHCGIPFVPEGELDRFIKSRVLMGALPSELTNLVGARMFLLQQEALV